MERVFKGDISKEEAFLEIDTKEKAADELVNETVERYVKHLSLQWIVRIFSF